MHFCWDTLYAPVYFVCLVENGRIRLEHVGILLKTLQRLSEEYFSRFLGDSSTLLLYYKRKYDMACLNTTSVC